MKSKKRKHKFKIGDWVIADCRAVPEIKDNVRTIARVQRWARGQVVGMTYRREGEIKGGGAKYSGVGDYDGDIEGVYLSITKTIPVYLIREGMTNNPIEVFEEDMKLAIGDIEGVPFRKTHYPPCTEDYRRQCREAAKDQSRINGKFTKETK